MKEAQAAGASTKEKLEAFANDAGYEVSVEEMQEFFKALTEEQEDVLSDMELNMVAGGKSGTGIASICLSIVSLGYLCLGFSIAAAEGMARECKAIFQ